MSTKRIAFVLGGGGLLGACEVGMLQALADARIRPDLVLGTSIGALNGAVMAAHPGAEATARLAQVWRTLERSALLSTSMLRRLTTLARTRTHLNSADELRALLQRAFHERTIESLPVQFQCVAASIERAAEHWFADGPIVDAVLASAALPGVLPPVRIGEEHFIDGGIVNSIPVGRAVALGATTVYVLQVGRVETPLHAPRWPWEVGLVAFEVARRHRYTSDMSSIPRHVRVHVLPTGMERPLRFNDLRQQLRYADASRVAQRIEAARRATAAYLRRQRTET